MQISDFILQAIYSFEVILKVFALRRIIVVNLWHMFDIFYGGLFPLHISCYSYSPLIV